MPTHTRRQAFGLLAAPLCAQASTRPNFVFILVDDMRWDSTGYAGHPFLKTPNIDRLAREGAQFTNAFVTTPLCSPSRGSFLTGQYVQTHGVVGNTPAGIPVSHKLETFPKLLRAAGYETGYFGKWHMGNDASPRPGFDRWVSFKGQGVYNDPPLNVDGKETQETGYITDILSAHAARFIAQTRSKPFCAYIGHKAIHGPFTPAGRHKDLYKTEPIPIAANATDDLKDKPALREVKPGGGSGDELIRNQLRCIASIDEGVGTLLAALEKTGQLDNTVFVFTSDNGYFWREHGLGDKRWAFDESIRIPLVIRYPKLVKPGARIPALAANIDIAPTFLDLAGAPIPAAIQGKSMRPLLRNASAKIRTELFCEYFKEANFPKTPSWRAIRTERYKYVHYPELTGADEFYDLRRDPGERKNIIGDAKAAAFRARLAKPGVPVA
ncbi:MAG: sulfatase [Bryobacterales bacterium]|nr:sulfatase [Bryobacterales bacterium]